MNTDASALYKSSDDNELESLFNDPDTVEKAWHIVAQRSFLLFVRGLIIPSAFGPVPFDSVMADFQRTTFEALAPSLQSVRDGEVPPVRRFWIERTKKASKDTDIAAALLWLIAYCKRPLLCQVCAANSEQAAIIEDRTVSLLHYNPWLRDKVEIVHRLIRSRIMPREVKVRIEATGSAGAAQGPTPDVLVLNELVHVDRWEVMKAHMNNASGVPRGVVIIATNAGVKGTPAEVWRRNAMAQKDRWATFVFKGRAPWIREEDVNDAKRMDPIGKDFARLWEGKWISGKGDALDEEAIDRCFVLNGPIDGPVEGCRYVAGLDLGISHDHSGLVVLAANQRKQTVDLVWMRGYVPSIPNDRGVLEVDLQQVEADCLRVCKLFRVEWAGYDPAAGGSFMAQRLRKYGIPMREVVFSSPAVQTEMARALVTAVKDQRLRCYDEDGRLRRDFGKFSITYRPPSRYKLEAVSDEYGHADVGVAVAMALPEALRRLETYGFEERDLIVDGDVTEDVVNGMPDELKQLYEMGE